MMLAPTRLRAEAAGTRERIAYRRGRVTYRVRVVGDQLHGSLGSFGILAAGAAAGAVFDRLKPGWRGVRAGAGLGVSLLKLSPVVQLISERVSALLSD